MSLQRLEELRTEMKKCVRCSLCKLVPMPTIRDARYTSACPPANEYLFHAYCGGGLQVMALSLIDGRVEADEEMARIVSACTTCGLCDVSCKFNMAAERLQVIMALKEHMVGAGYGPAAASPPAELPEHWAAGLGLKRLPGARAEVLLYAGAAASRDAQQAATARKLARLLQHAGVDLGILGEDEPDSGLEAYWTGQRQAFERQVVRVVERLDGTGASTVVTLGGEDLGLLRAKYLEYGRAPRATVLHASELLWRLIERGRLRMTQPVRRKVTYHDPCYLGRQSEPPQAWQGEERLTHGVMRYTVPPKPVNYGTNGVYDAPRRVLRSIPGLELVEMYRIREYAFCCGGGGDVPEAHPAVARSAALHRLDEARAVGAEEVVTACAHCRRNLQRWQEADAMPVTDLVDVVYEAAGLGDLPA